MLSTSCIVITYYARKLSFDTYCTCKPFVCVNWFAYSMVVLLHAFIHTCLQLTWTAKSLVATYSQMQYATEHAVGYLPLSHIAAQVTNTVMIEVIGHVVSILCL